MPYYTLMSVCSSTVHGTYAEKHLCTQIPVFTLKKLRGFGPRANSADRATATCWRILVPTFVDRGCCVVSATDSPVVSLGFLDRSRYCFFPVAPQLSSRGWVDPVPDPLLLRKSGSVGNRTWDLWICSQKLWPLDHRGGLLFLHINEKSLFY
jgi:hypothetical protein